MKKSGIGDLIRTAREAAGLSQAQLAERVGTKQQTIDKIELGKTKFSRFFDALERELSLTIPRTRTEPAHKNPLPDAEARLVVSKDQMQPRGASGIDRIKATGSPIYAGETRDFPIFSAAEGGKGVLVLSPEPVEWDLRPVPVSGVKSAYGIIVVGDSMTPEFEPGDVALVNPTLPPRPNVTCIFYAEPPEGGTPVAQIKRLVRITAELWHVQQFNPARGEKAHLTLSRREWGTCHRVIGRYAAR